MADENIFESEQVTLTDPSDRGGPLGVSGEEITRQARAVSSPRPDVMRPAIDVETASEDEIFRDTYTTNNPQEDFALRELIYSDKVLGYLSPKDKDLLDVGGSLDENGRIVPGMAKRASFQSDDRVREMRRRDARALLVRSDPGQGTRKIRLKDGTVTHYKLISLPNESRPFEAMGYVRDATTGEYLAPEPKQSKWTSWFYTVNREDKADQYNQRLLKNGVTDAATRTRMVEDYVSGMAQTARTASTVSDFGKFVVNAALGSIGMLARAAPPEVSAPPEMALLFPEQYTPEEPEGIPEDVFENAQSMAVLTEGSRDILSATITSDPEHQEKVSIDSEGNRRIRIEYLPYARDILAENLGITPDQSERIIQNMSADMFDRFSTLAIETAPFAALEGLYVLKAGAKTYNRFRSFTTNQYSGLKYRKDGQIKTVSDFDTAIEFADASDLSLVDLTYNFANADVMSGTFLRRSSFTHQLGVARLMDLTRIGEAGTVAGRAISAKNAADLSNQYFSSYQSKVQQSMDPSVSVAAAAKLRASAGKDWLNSQKVRLTAIAPKALIDLAGDETWAATGAAGMETLFRDALGEQGEDYVPMAQLTGALVGVSFLPQIVGRASKFAIQDVPDLGMRALSSSYRQARAQGTTLEQQLRAQDAYSFIYTGTTPEFQQQIERQIGQFVSLENRLLQLQDAQGVQILKEGDIPALLGDVTGLVVLRDLADYLDGRMSTMDIVNGSAAIAEKTNIQKQRQALSERLADALNKIRPFERQLEEEGSEGAASLIRGIESMKDALDKEIAEDALELTEQTGLIEDGINLLLSDGFVNRPGKDIAGINAGDLIDAHYTAKLNKFVGEDGAIEDVQGALSALEDAATSLKNDFDERGLSMSRINNMTSEEGAGRNVVSRAAASREADTKKRDLLYDAATEAAPDARMDGSEIFEQLIDNGALVYLDEGLEGIGTNGRIDSTTRQALRINDIEFKKEMKWKALFNSSALEYFQKSALGRSMGIEEGASMRQVADKVEQFTTSIMEQAGDAVVEGARPIDYWYYLRSKFNQMDEATASAMGMSVEEAQNISAQFRLPVSMTQLKHLTQSLVVKGDVKGGSDIIRVNMRKELMQQAESEATGFRNNFFDVNPEFIGEEAMQPLKEANAFNREFVERWNPKAGTAGEISRRTIKSPKKPSEAMANIMAPAIKALDEELAIDYLDETVGSDLARIFGGEFDGERFYLTAEAAEAAKGVVMRHINRRWFMSGPGREIIERADRGNLPIGTYIEAGRVKQFRESVDKDSRVMDSINDDKLIEYVENLANLPVYTKNADGTFTQTGNFLSHDEAFQAIDIELFAGTNLSKTDRIGLYGQGTERVAMDLKAGISKVRESITTAERQAREKVRRDFGSIVSLGNNPTGPGRVRALFQTATNDVGLEQLVSYRSNLVRSGDAEAVKVFDEEMKDVVFSSIARNAVTADGLLDVNKLRQMRKDPGINRAIKQFGGDESLQVFDDIILLSERSLSKKGISRFTGTPQPYGIDAELNKIWAVSQGRGSARWWALQLLVRQGRQQNLQTFRAMLTDPAVGRELIKMIKERRQPNAQSVRRVYDTLLTYSARDVYLYHGEDARNAVLQNLNEREIEVGNNIESEMGGSAFAPDTAERLKYNDTTYREIMEGLN